LTSVGELEITRSTSLIAVCCSSDSFVSLNRRTFSMAITAWSAKVLSSATWESAKEPVLLRVTARAPIGSSSRIIGTTSTER
jgi:hypothetical protein